MMINRQLKMVNEIKQGRSGFMESRERMENALHGVVVCSTGLTSLQKDELRGQVIAMGGSFDANLTMKSTHLAAACSDTEKYRVATAMKDVIVVRPSWVLDSCRRGKRLPCEEYAVPPFEGLRITVTGLPIERKEQLRVMIESGGGRYMGAMEMNSTTHLVAEVAAGAKYEAAMSPEWQGTVKVVRSRWLKDSYTRKLRLPEENFRVSTVEDQLTGHDGDDREEEQRPNGSREREDAGARKNPAYDHQRQGGRLSVSRDAGVVAAASLPAPGESLCPWGDARTIADDGETAAGEEESNRPEGVPTKEEALALPDGMYLSGCRLMLVGFAAEALLPLSFLVRKGCGVRYTSPNEEITHVIVGDRSLANPELVSALESHPCSPALVTASWLLETCRTGRMLATDGYLNSRPSDGGRAGSADGRGVGGGGGGDEGRGGGGSGRRFGVGPNRPLGGAAAERASHAGDPPTKSQAGGGGGNAGIKGVGSNVGGDDTVGRKNREGDDIDRHRSVLKREGSVSANFKDGHLRNGDVSKVPKPAERVARAASATLEHGAMIVHAGVGEGEVEAEILATVPVDVAGRRHGSVRSSSSRRRRATGDGCVGDRGDRRGLSCIFSELVFVVHRTGLRREEEERAARIVVKHGGRCLERGDTRSASALRHALLSARVEMTPASAVGACDEAATETGAPRPGLSGAARCFFVSKHGCCPLDDGGEICDAEPIMSPESRESQLSPDMRSILASEARAEIVTLLWLEACNRAGDFRQPYGCEKVFRPQLWAISSFPEWMAHKIVPTEGGSGGEPRAGIARGGSRFAVAVTGFVGSERAGWEQLIKSMGAEMCKSLKKRFTTHLVCKDARGEKYETAIKWGVHVVTADWLLRCARHGYQAGLEKLYHPGRVVEENKPLVTTAAKTAAEETSAEAAVVKSTAEPLSFSGNTSALCTTPLTDDKSGEPASGTAGIEMQQTARSEAKGREGHRTEHSVLRALDTATPGTMSKSAHALLLQSTGGAEIASHHQSADERENAKPLKTIAREVLKEDLPVSGGQGVSAAVAPDTIAATVTADLTPATSELERQLRSMLSAAEGSGAGTTADAATDGLEAPALHRRLRLNARGVRPTPFSANIIPNAVPEPAGEGRVSSRSTAIASTTARATESNLTLLSCRTSSEGQGSPDPGLLSAPLPSFAAPIRYPGDKGEKMSMEAIADGTYKRNAGLLDGGDRKRRADFRKTLVARSRRRVGGDDRGGSALSSVVNERDVDRRMNCPPPPLVVARKRSAAKDHVPWEGQENDPLWCRGLLQERQRAEGMFNRARHDGGAVGIAGNSGDFWDVEGSHFEQQQHLEEDSQIVTYE